MSLEKHELLNMQDKSIKSSVKLNFFNKKALALLDFVN